MQFDMQTLGSRPTMPKNLPGYRKERKQAKNTSKEYGGVKLDESTHSFYFEGLDNPGLA
jgi:hypothetical protein